MSHFQTVIEKSKKSKNLCSKEFSKEAYLKIAKLKEISSKICENSKILVKMEKSISGGLTNISGFFEEEINSSHYEGECYEEPIRLRLSPKLKNIDDIKSNHI